MADKLDDSAPFNDDQGTRTGSEHSGSTGAGAEAAEGIHGAPKGRPNDRSQRDQSSLEDRPTGDDSKSGSEPLSDSDQHRSKYGGGSRQA